MQIIKIMYHDEEVEKLKKIPEGNWVDLRSAEDIVLKAGDFHLVDLGVSMELPIGYEAILAPRSSTFKTFGVIQTNGIGVIDNSYCGSQDVWKMPVYATRDTVICKNDRIAQFRIQRVQPEVFFKAVDNLDENVSRGGFGSTGKD